METAFRGASQKSCHARSPPLILSLSPWEKGRLLALNVRIQGPFSHGERDRVRGDSPSSFRHPTPTSGVIS